MDNISYNRLFPGFAIFLLIVLLFTVILAKRHNSTTYFENWAEGWREVSSFNIPRRAPAAVISGDFIYILGGVDENGNYVKSVEYSHIKPNGNLSAWKKTSDIVEGRFYLGAASDGKSLYALGGGGGPIGDDNIPLASVERASIHPDGSLGEWQQHSYLTTPRRGLKIEHYNDQIYAIGGYNGQFLRSTERLELTSLPHWILDENEAQVDRYIHATALIDNHLYLLGGHVEKAGPMSYGDIEMTNIRKNGSLEPWKISPSRLNNARFIATGYSLGKYLYVAGGHNGIQRLDSVEMASTDQNGNVSQWELLTPMIFKRSAAASAVYGERVYILGGMGDQGVLNTVETAILGPGGKLGHLINHPDS